MTERLAAKFPGSVGTVLQAYLFRTDTDTDRLLGREFAFVLCKGAYKEGPEVAFPDKADVDANYVELMKRMVSFHNPQTGKGVFCGIATHDEAIVDKMRAFVNERKIDKRAFEFQMLYGVRRDLQRRLAAEGYGVRVYIPFGPEWYPYFMRRLAERPANVLFLAKNFFKKLKPSLVGGVAFLGITKINFKKWKILDVRRVSFSRHVFDTNHHILTIKKPRSTPHFFKNPSKNPSKTNKSPGVIRGKKNQTNLSRSILRRNRLPPATSPLTPWSHCIRASWPCGFAGPANPA